jgi:hypothetical protein
VVRNRSWTPSSSSSFATLRLAEDLGMPSSFAAAEKLAVRATASNTVRRLRSIVPLREQRCIRDIIARTMEQLQLVAIHER